jgi:peptide/nickel transport system substrate-binding protein
MVVSSQGPQPGGRTTRRRLLGAAGVGAGALSLNLAAACGGSSAPSSSGAGATGPLVFGMLTTIPGLDPQRFWNGAAQNGTANIFEGLLTLQPYTSQIQPQLATALPTASRGDTRYTFTLHDGVRFSDGTPLTSADVKFSFERLVLPSVGAEIGSIYQALAITGMSDVVNEHAKTLSGITTPDARTIVFDLDEPDSAFLPALTYPSAGVVSKAAFERMGQAAFNWAPMGSGPYQAKVVNRTQQIVLERNRKYWRPGVPSIEQVTWNMGVDPNLSVLRIERGQQDMMFEETPSGMIDSLRNNPQYTHDLIVTPQNNCYWISLNSKHPALAKLKVRQAIAMAIDKQHVVQVLRGLARAANGGIFSPLSPYYQPDLGYPYDPNRAKQLLTEAGYPNGFAVDFWGANSYPWLDMGQAIQQNLSAIGINVTFKPMTYDAFVSFTGNSPAGIIEFAWELAYPSGSYIIDSAFTQAAIKAGCCNYATYSSAYFDNLAQEAHRATDPAKVDALYKQMDSIVTRQQAVWVPIVYPSRADFISSRVRGFQGSPDEGEDQWKYFYRYSLA